MKYLIQALEWIFWQLRNIVFIGVLAGLISSIVLAVLGSMDAYNLLISFFKALGSKKAMMRLDAGALVKGIDIILLYLSAALSLLFSYGLFQVFIKRVSSFENSPDAGPGFIINNLENFRDKFLKLIHIILITVFFKYALTMNYSGVKELAFLAGGILMVAGSMYLASKN